MQWELGLPSLPRGKDWCIPKAFALFISLGVPCAIGNAPVGINPLETTWSQMDCAWRGQAVIFLPTFIEI